MTHSRTPFHRLLLPAASICLRELLRFTRQKSRILGALATPIVLWLLIGAGVGRSFRPTETSHFDAPSNYLAYSFPGTLTLILLFTAVFSMISVIDDRREGFLQAVIAAPISRFAIVAGKVSGCALLAVGQAGIFLCFAPLAGIPLTLVAILTTLAVMALVAIALAGLALTIAWPMDSTQGFHAIMNLVLIPMWLTSGALFPTSGAMSWLAWVIRLNPLTYAVEAIRSALYSPPAAPNANGQFASFSTCLLATIIFAVILNALAACMVARRT